MFTKRDCKEFTTGSVSISKEYFDRLLSIFGGQEIHKRPNEKKYDVGYNSHFIVHNQQGYISKFKITDMKLFETVFGYLSTSRYLLSTASKQTKGSSTTSAVIARSDDARETFSHVIFEFDHLNESIQINMQIQKVTSMKVKEHIEKRRDDWIASVNSHLIHVATDGDATSDNVNNESAGRKKRSQDDVTYGKTSIGERKEYVSKKTKVDIPFSKSVLTYIFLERTNADCLDTIPILYHIVEDAPNHSSVEEAIVTYVKSFYSKEIFNLPKLLNIENEELQNIMDDSFGSSRKRKEAILIYVAKFMDSLYQEKLKQNTTINN
jgi:hypothetical protein